MYQILASSGLDETYYRLRSASDNRSLRAPANTLIDPPLLSELDSASFAESHSQKLDGGYSRTHLFIDGVHCAACVWLVERLPSELKGVRSAQLNLPRARLSLEWNSEQVKLSEVASWLAKFGYSVQSRVDGEEATETKDERSLLIKMGVSWALAGNVMLLTFALYAGLTPDSTHLFEAARWASLLLAIPCVLIGGSVFFKRAYYSVRLAFSAREFRYLHMDTPISIGILVGFFTSLWSTFQGQGEVWFDSITVLIAALLTARWLQIRARRLAGNSSEQLLALLPSIARKVGKSGQLVKIKTEELIPGDRVVVYPGELIPVDGKIQEGSSLINTAVLTGESMPQRSHPGDSVFAGSTNESDQLRITVGAAGASSRIGRLLSWVIEDSDSKPPILGWSSSIGGWFTVVVLFLATVTALIWAWFEPASIPSHVVALLVITCPCALGMATPLALAVGTGKAAKKGIFIKSEAVLDWISKTNVVVLDKTGTLTSGVPAVVDVFLSTEWLEEADLSGQFNTYQKNEARQGLELVMQNTMLRYAAALERNSIHPLAKAFTATIPTNTLPEVSEVHHVQGAGIQGKIENKTVRIGSPNWISNRTNNSESIIQNIQLSQKTVVLLEVESRLAAIFAISDPLRDNAAALINQFKKQGKRVYICSGDQSLTTKLVGSSLGIPEDQCLGDQSPIQKKEFISELKRQGGIVGMIGDGVNDGGALKEAHVGIAVTDGTAASKFAADAYTTRSGLEAIEELFVEGPKVMKVINRNLLISLGYNALGASLAMAGLVTPLVAAVAMPLSSLAVVVLSISQPTFKRTGYPSP